MEETEDERRLRHAACLLSDVGWRVHPDYRGQQSLSTIVQAGLGGVDHAGRIFLSLAVFYRHDTSEQSTDALAEQLRNLVGRRAQRRARIIGSAIRAAHMLSIGRPGVIDETTLKYENGKLVLIIPKAYAGLDGERLRRRFEALCGLIGVRPELRISL